MKKLRSLSIAAIISMSGNMAWACTVPAKPELPDPETAVTPQMIKAQNDVKAFLAAGEKFLKCNSIRSKHDDMVDSMHSVAESFNAIIRAYKARVN